MFVLVKEGLEMCRLFIIGNGFDLAHQLPTSYDNFKNYLSEFAGINKDNVDNFTIPDIETNSDDVYSVGLETSAGFLYNLLNNTQGIGERWQDFEAALGRLNFRAVFDDICPIVYDRDGDTNYFYTANNQRGMGRNINIHCTNIYDIFSDWIGSIHLNNVAPLERFNMIFDRNSLFLTFNYTRTLENIYHIQPENICHIHGMLNEPLIVGHGLNDEEIRRLHDTYAREFIGAEDDLTQTIRELRKAVTTRINLFQDFFERLNNITEIYSYGFSFSNVDLPYIERICAVINTCNVTWYQYTYNGSDYTDILKRCGFNGGIMFW